MTIDDILEFWFGAASDVADDAAVAKRNAQLWWSKNEATDREIRERFESVLEKAVRGELDSWRASPRGVLALILLVDQFTRNMYRGTPRSFAHDALARELCRDALARGADAELRPIERVFVYLPLEHSEDRQDQAESVRLFEGLLESVPPGAEDTFREFLDYAVRHREIIDRFGRFPHRNSILGRESTPEESEFLEQPGSSF